MADQLGRPEIRSWEVTSNTTRYEKLLAAPSDEALRIMWSGWAAVGGVLCVFVVVVFLSILFSPKARENPFNVYICGLMVPDIVFGILCSVTCALNASKGEYFAEWMCRFQSFYTVWSVSSSAWLNGIVSWQLYTMLASSHIRMRYKPPPIKTVIKHACIVYIYSAFLASFGLYDISWLPHKTTGAVSGMGCIPLEFSLGSSLFYFLVFLPLMAGIPLSYVIWICYDIWKRKLMPPSGRRRLLFIYFIRIIASFIIMWVPFLVLVFIAGNWPWGVWAGGTWAHFQGGVGAALSMWKPDVKEAVKEFLCCSKKSEADGEVRDFPPKSRASVGLFGGLSRLTIGSSTRWSSWSNRWSTGFGDKARNRVSLNQNGDHRTSNLGRDNMDIKALDPIAEARSSQETRSTLFESQAPPITEIEHLPAVQETSQDSFNEDEQQVIKENSDIMLVMKETKSQDEGPADEEQENTETTEVDDLVDGTEMNTNQGIDASKPGNSEDSVRDVEEGLCELQARRVDFCGEIYDSINSDSIE